MKQMTGVVTVLMVAVFVTVAQGFTTSDTGRGIVYKLGVTQDVSLEDANHNHNKLKWLMVSKHPGYPNKRSLVQFENLPSACPASQIQSAKMYLFYEYAHKASGKSISQIPFIPRCLQVHLVRKSWKEAEATSTKRDDTNLWSTPYLGLDNNDAELIPQGYPVTIFPQRPKGFVEFDITNAVRSWRWGTPNHGVVIRATNELDPGRGIRFFSNASPTSSQHAFVLVLCTQTCPLHSSRQC